MTAATYQNRGLVKQGTDDAAFVNLAHPTLRDDYILVKTIAVALNPADWQDLGEEFKPGTEPLLMGCDYAGIVEAIGGNVSKKLIKGDHVMGFVHGTNEANPEDGAFAEHIVAKGDICLHIPSYLSFSATVTLPSALATVALGLYRHLGLPLLPATVVATTCSPRNFDLVQALGADAVFDYRDPECTQSIRTLTSDSLTLVFDTIATPETANIAAQSMSSSKGGSYCNLMGVNAPRKDIKSIFFLGYTAIGEAYDYEGERWPVVPEDYELVKKFVILAEELLEQRKIKPHPAAVRTGGLEGIMAGLEDLKHKRISGEKLVYVVGHRE